MTLPKRIVFFWAQGAAAAPQVVQRCWRAWGEKNPGWEIIVADSEVAKKTFKAAGILHEPLTLQGQADIFRVLNLASHGGVYVDAATVPILPLDQWIHDLTTRGAFLFHDPYRKRSVENWFLACESGDPIMRSWARQIVGYWDRPRDIQTCKRSLDAGWLGALAARRDVLAVGRSNGAASPARRPKRVIEPKDRIWSVKPEGGAQRPLHPYFWPHYLFDLMLEEAPEIRALWGQVPKLPSYKELMLRHWKRRYAEMTGDDIQALMKGARMQKLALNKLPSEYQMEQIFKFAGLMPFDKNNFRSEANV